MLNAILRLPPAQQLADVIVIENKALMQEFIEDKTGRLDIRAETMDGVQINIEMQLANLFQCEFKMFGFQDQEDGTILESEERSVGTSYVSTEAFGSVTYSPPTMLQSKASSSKSDILNILENNMDRRTLFYFGKLFLESIKSGDKFQNLKRTITINLMNFNFLPIEPFHSTFHLYEDYRRDYMLTDLIELHFIEFPKFRAMQHDLHDPLHRLLLFMEENLTEEQLEELIQMDPMIKKPRSGWNESKKHFRFNQVAA